MRSALVQVREGATSYGLGIAVKSFLAGLSLAIIIYILTVDAIYSAGVKHGSELRESDIQRIVKSNKEVLTQVCYAWWFKTAVADKNLSVSRKVSTANSRKTGK